MFQGEITIGDVRMPVHVLNDGRRVIAQREMVGVLAPGVDSGGLQRYVSNIPKEVSSLDLVPNFVQFKVPATQFTSHGYKATFLVDICSTYLEAREKRLLKKNQLHLAKRSEIVLRACAKVGIEALIDATAWMSSKKNLRQSSRRLAFRHPGTSRIDRAGRR